ncbi:MAG: phosphoglycerate dehydrogenase [Balneolaceae bacterium]
MPKRILLLDNVDPLCAKTFQERGFVADQPGKLTDDELKKRIGDYEGLVVRSGTTVTADLLGHAKQMRVIGRAGVGVDNIDLPAATSKGILVMNTPDGNTISTAEHTCGMIIALSRNIPEAVSRVKGGGWDRKSFMGVEVHGKTLGVIGLGKIGSEVALRMQAFGMKVIAFDPFTAHERAKELGVELKGLEDVLGEADYLTVHTPLTEKTKGMVSLQTAGKLKKGIRIINCARGGIFEESDLIPLIESGVVAGAAVDVYSSEPPTPELYEMLNHPHIVCTPHLGASTEEAQEKVALQIAEQMADALENKSFKGSLNAKSISLLADADVKPYLELAEKLGQLAGQLMQENENSFSFEYTGTCSRYSDLLTDGIISGMLRDAVSESVNLINARYFAEERGYQINETTSSNSKMYKDLITITLGGGNDYSTISAALFGPGDYRIVEVDGYGLELRLEGDILMYQNIDKPGMLASVAGALSSQNVNIGALSLGRSGKGKNAITAVVVDRRLTGEELTAVRELDGVRSVRYISLN